MHNVFRLYMNRANSEILYVSHSAKIINDAQWAKY